MTKPANQGTIGLAGALSIGIGGMVGGGFFATFGLTVAGAKGATPLAFLIGGLIALVTAYSYIGLTQTFPGPGGTVSFISLAFGTGLPVAAVNVLLVLSYVAIMSVYASALASYTVPYLPESIRVAASHALASGAIIGLALINFVGAGLIERTEVVFYIGKLSVLGLFIVGGFFVGGLAWDRLAPAAWVPPSAIVAAGMLGFLAYEGFELIANASGSIRDREKTLPAAFLGSVLITIAIYVLAFIVGIGHLSFEAIAAAKDFALSAAAGGFLGPAGFAMMAVGGVLASASAINADYFGAAKLPPQLAQSHELSSTFLRSIRGKQAVSVIVIAGLALIAVNLIPIESLSAATSGGFLLVYAAVNAAAFRLAGKTGASKALTALACALCLTALAMMIGQFLSDPATISSAYAVAGMVALSIMIEWIYIIRHRAQTAARGR